MADLRGSVGTVSSALYRPGGAVVAPYLRTVQVAGSNPALVIIFLLQHNHRRRRLASPLVWPQPNCASQKAGRHRSAHHA